MAYPSVASYATSAAPAAHAHIDCSTSLTLCTEVNDSSQVFGWYVGHDEPSVLFYAKTPGAGNRMRYGGIIPSDPAPTNVPGKHTYNFQLYAAFWYGMAMCDTQSYPETVKTCLPDSDKNIVRAGDPYHPGTAYMELQFYPPGYVQQWNGFSCSKRQWCVALNIDSYSLDPVTGKYLNNSCASKVGVEYVNFAYLTHDGKPQGPPNPVHFSPTASGTPNPHKVLFLNPGDHYTVTLHDTPSGLQTVVDDTTTGMSGSMTASAANGFGQVKYAPTGTSCVNIPYNFHPMYSTSTPLTTVPWAAATYNVAFDTEVGHWDYCSAVSSSGVCTGYEGVGANREKADPSVDDIGCWPGSAAGLIHIGGCEYSNVGYDGTSYLKDWPNGNTTTRPGPTIFTSPLTGPNYMTNYMQAAFNTDLPDIESQLGYCQRYLNMPHPGKGCTRIPRTDDGTFAQFYPYYTMGHALGGCAWTVGQWYPGFSTRNFGANAQYGKLLAVRYIEPHGTTETRYNDFNNVLPNNPCPANG